MVSFMKKSILLAVSLAVSIPTVSSAQTLMEALAQTYKTNPVLKADRAQLRSVDENIALAKSGYRPSVYLQGSYAEGNTDNRDLPRDYDYDRRTVSANIEQPVFRGFRTINGVRAADSFIRSEQDRFFNSEQEILLSSATSYLDVLRDQAIVNLQKNNEALLKKRLDETIERFNVGEVTRTDVAQARARYSRAQSDRINAQGAFEASRAAYVRIIGQEPTILSEPDNIKSQLPNTFDEALQITIKNNYNVKQAKNYLKSAIYTVAQNTGELLPTAGLKGSASNSKSTADSWVNQDSKADNYEVSVNMTVPLYSAGESRSRIRQSKYLKWQAQEQVLAAERQAVETVTSSWELMVSNQARIQSILDQVKASEIALEGVQKEEALGNRTVLDVLDSYQELLNSNVEEVKARRDYYVSAMALLLSMGKFTAEDLNLDVELYDPKKHFKKTRDKWLSTGVDIEN